MLEKSIIETEQTYTPDVVKELREGKGQLAKDPLTPEQQQLMEELAKVSNEYSELAWKRNEAYDNSNWHELEKTEEKFKELEKERIRLNEEGKNLKIMSVYKGQSNPGQRVTFETVDNKELHGLQMNLLSSQFQQIYNNFDKRYNFKIPNEFREVEEKFNAEIQPVVDFFINDHRLTSDDVKTLWNSMAKKHYRSHKYYLDLNDYWKIPELS